MSDWYYAADNEQKGPINDAELKAQLASSKIPSDALVWTDGMENWTPANQVAALKNEPAKVQPATSTTPASTVVSSGPGSDPHSAKPVDIANLIGKPESLEVTPEDVEQNRIFGILAYLGFFVLVPIIVAKDSPFAKYHANQGLILAIIELVIFVFLSVITLIVYSVLPIAHYLTAFLELVWLAPLVLAILGIINAAQGKCVPLPIIGVVKLLK